MHFSAKRGSDCMLSVRLSVRNVGGSVHIGWKSWKLIARTISPTPSIFEETRGGVGKSGVLEHTSGNRPISETRRDRGKVTMEVLYRNSPMLFRTVPSPIPYGRLFTKIGGSQPHPKFRSLLPQERVKLQTSNLAGMFAGSMRTKVLKNFGKKERGGI